MLKKTMDALKKLEFGMLELFLGALMVIGLMGYFGSIPADLDWIDHTTSFILFSYLFYKLNITSILFGKTSKPANLIIIFSFFSLFFKDIISYTALNAFKFNVITFVDSVYLFLAADLAFVNIASFYIGIAGIFIASIYITKKIGISHPSFLYVVFDKPIKNKAAKFFAVFASLAAFYYLVYSIVLEWLEFTIDDPVILTGIIYYVYRIAKHHQKFRRNDFVFKIGDLSTSWYSKFVSLFHYKKTLPLAISGLLVFHAVADLGVFAYSLTFLKQNFYLEHLDGEYTPFLSLFLRDAENIPESAILPLFAAYLLNALSLVIFFLIPVVVWARMFAQREIHFNRAWLFFIYSSAAAYILLPGYTIQPLSEPSIAGVDISSVSLLTTVSVLDGIFSERASLISAVFFISIIFGLAVYALSCIRKCKRELYAISAIGGLAFYAVYIYYFFSSLASYFHQNIIMFMPTRHFLIGIMLLIFLTISTAFYIGGYLMFLYEIAMEYHHRKWSEPIDEEVVSAIAKIKKWQKTWQKTPS